MAETRAELGWRNRGWSDVKAGRPAPAVTSTAWRRMTESERNAYLRGRRNAVNDLERNAAGVNG